MSNPSERVNYMQDSSSDTETDYKETDGRGRHRLYKNRLRYKKNFSYLNSKSLLSFGSNDTKNAVK